MDFKKVAAIDIGSNSVRLLISNVIEQDGVVLFKKGSLIRIPVRLGVSAFTEHKIPQTVADNLVNAINGFRYIMRANQVVHYLGCATSAMREAKNGKAITKRILDETGIEIEIITGSREAALIFESQQAQANKINKHCIFVDVGGGSTEITIFANQKAIAATSFNIGTIRILQNQVSKEDWKSVKEWLKKNLKGINNFSIIGSGGNINRISKMAQLKPNKPMSFNKLKDLVEHIKSYSIDDRIKILDLNPDRADVIVPAGEIFLTLMQWMDLQEIYVPKIGLSDGIVREVYRQYKASNFREKQ
ncbi:MAG: exopolyphosphatase [Chitinophagales bacterium]|nr:exopolyphosphatase [Chitinophagales bacterium]MCO5281583.1 exopolyphosphatase [Chitinophagales bacterium]HRN95194.1 exopolyphosphatase [Chitinophagales bacterium]HRP39698.1 exopolyphosphatase [Chitinophagales bacterium]